MTDARAHWTLDDEVVFLNHGSFGACPRPVLARQAALRAELERQPVRFMDHLEPRLDAARARVADLVGADPDDLAFVDNATTAVNTVLRSLAFAPGDEIVVTDHGYNACTNAAAFAAERGGARVVTATIPFPIADPMQATTAIADAVTARTRLVVVDHITSPTALVLPILDICAALADRGIDVLIDGAHAPGMVPLDLGALAAAGATYYTGNLHKWVCAPKGSAFLFVRRDRQERIRPLVISHGANARRDDKSRFQLEMQWTGTRDPTPHLCVPDALDFLGSLRPGGLEAHMTANRALALEGRDLVAAALGVAPPAPDAMIGSIAALPLPDARPEAPPIGHVPALQQAVLDGDRIQTMIALWPAWPRRLVRLSAQAYNRRDDFERLAAALARRLSHSRD